MHNYRKHQLQYQKCQKTYSQYNFAAQIPLQLHKQNKAMPPTTIIYCFALQEMPPCKKAKKEYKKFQNELIYQIDTN